MGTCHVVVPGDRDMFHGCAQRQGHAARPYLGTRHAAVHGDGDLPRGCAWGPAAWLCSGMGTAWWWPRQELGGPGRGRSHGESPDWAQGAKLQMHFPPWVLLSPSPPATVPPHRAGCRLRVPYPRPKATSVSIAVPCPAPTPSPCPTAAPTCCWLCSSRLSLTSRDWRASRKALRCLRSAM